MIPVYQQQCSPAVAQMLSGGTMAVWNPGYEQCQLPLAKPERPHTLDLRPPPAGSASGLAPLAGEEAAGWTPAESGQ